MNENVTAEEQYDRYIAPVAMISRVISIWPLDDGHSAIKGYLRVCHRTGMLILCATMAFAVTADAARHWNNMDEFTECALIASAFYLSFVRMVIYTIHGKDMSYVIDTMRDDWIKSTPEDRLVLKEKCHFSFMLAKQFIVTVAVALILFMLVPILDIMVLHSEERTLPFRGYFYVNQMSSPYYEFIYICTAIGGGLCGSTIASATSFNLVATMHGAARFGVLQKRLEAIKRTDPECHMTVGKCIERHQDAIKYYIVVLSFSNNTRGVKKILWKSRHDESIGKRLGKVIDSLLQSLRGFFENIFRRIPGGYFLSPSPERSNLMDLGKTPFEPLTNLKQF